MRWPGWLWHGCCSGAGPALSAQYGCHTASNLTENSWMAGSGTVVLNALVTGGWDWGRDLGCGRASLWSSALLR